VPGLGHQALAGLQMQRLAAVQHMVDAIPLGGDPDPALVHHQPAAAARLQRHRSGKAQRTLGRAQHLQGAGAKGGGGGGGGHGVLLAWACIT
jgi:hypothetical protein